MEEYIPPVRGARWVLATAVLALVAGIAAHLALAARIDRRIAHGVGVPAQVTAIQRLPLGKTSQPQRLTVAYDRAGPRTARLVAALAEGDYRVGDRVTLLVDPADPGRVATADGFASEGLILLVPPATAFYGALALLIVAVRRGRWWWQHERRAPAGVPLLTVTGSREDEAVMAWAWAKEARRVSAAAAEVSTGRSGPLRLLIYIRVGATGHPRVAYYSKRSRRLVVVGAVPPTALGGSPREAVQATIDNCVASANRWAARHQRGTDVSLTEAARALTTVEVPD